MQEYVETAKKVVTSATKKVVKKSAEIYETTKVSLKISALKSKIDEKYCEIGKIAYKGYKGESVSPDAADKLFAEIDGINENISELSSKLSEMKDVKVCPSCGAEISKTSTFCAECGEKID